MVKRNAVVDTHLTSCYRVMGQLHPSKTSFAHGITAATSMTHPQSVGWTFTPNGAPPIGGCDLLERPCFGTACASCHNSVMADSGSTLVLLGNKEGKEMARLRV
ncbi:hypothetical protein PoB_002162500 [Plakobranchus ocellatus]|uniref:Uncharacterized protein n=1 Tax=Plakobranchus ocellatus TaxID=259542 RepID=A0AAV3ZHL1_9GAST|nr:hypothetical protein PoB_002162500 [Plakobranchus ocellatus]